MSGTDAVNVATAAIAVDEVTTLDLADVFNALPAGTSIDKYKVAAVIGQGSFGITYRATDSRLGRDVAIKEYMPAMFALRQPDGRMRPRSAEHGKAFQWGLERFLVEARLLAQLPRAPGVVSVYDYVEANGTAYMVMELIDGETLDALLRRDGTLEPSDLGRVARQLMDGLAAVHAADILHRDIKPGNILIDRKGDAFLIDFGASRVAIEGRTQALTAVYTPAYAALEQFNSARQGPWTDIYGLGATLYHCVAGVAPPVSTDRVVDDDAIPAVRSGDGRYPPDLLRAIDAALKVKATERPQSIARWRGMLDDERPSTSGRRRWLLVAIVVCLMIGGAYFWFRPGPPPVQSAARPVQPPAPVQQPIAPAPTPPAPPAAAPAPAPVQPAPSPPPQVRIPIPTLPPLPPAQPAPPAPVPPAKTAQDGADAYDKGDYATALSILRPLAVQGDARSQNYLGMMSMLGRGVKQDDVQAVYWYRLAAQQGWRGAQYNLGHSYESGIGLPANAVEAARWYQRAADQGEPNAQFKLGICYRDGIGVQQDYATALMWLQRAGSQGIALAHSVIGYMHSTAKGVPKNSVEAAKWYLRAAAQGEPGAQFNLGLLYERGEGVGADIVQAYMWSGLAANQGRSDAAQSRDRIAARMTSEQLQRGRRLVQDWKPGRQ